MKRLLLPLLCLLWLLACGPAETDADETAAGQIAPATTEAPAAPAIQLDRFESTIRAYESADSAQAVAKGEVLFTGSSSIYFWRSLKEDMAPMAVHNRGFGGSTIPEVIHYADRIIFPYEPSIILLYCGENDIAAGATATESFESFKQFVAMVEARLPQTRIAFLAMKPSVARWELWPQYQEANRMIKDFISQQEKLDYIAVDAPMLYADGMVDSTIFVKDMLHMNAEGYKRWTAVVKPYLTKQLQK
ncbi:MAG: SGNH/GDSL hydrolase family protein [Bacteroidota bacterium]